MVLCDDCIDEKMVEYEDNVQVIMTHARIGKCENCKRMTDVYDVKFKLESEKSNERSEQT